MIFSTIQKVGFLVGCDTSVASQQATGSKLMQKMRSTETSRMEIEIDLTTLKSNTHFLLMHYLSCICIYIFNIYIVYYNQLYVHVKKYIEKGTST